MRSSDFPLRDSPRSPGPGDWFTCRDAAADALTAGRIRGEFAHWLRRHTRLDETRLCDVLLSLNEALANAAEFAYLDGSAGTCDVQAVRDGDRRTLTVTVVDRGRWREPDAADRRRRRGRGIPLMRTLADALVINPSASGTVVCMRFDGVHAGHPAAIVVE
jgi:serine/threonine-protein kinase RsbW